MGKNFMRATLACALAALPAVAVADPPYDQPYPRSSIGPNDYRTEGLSRRDLRTLALVHEANQQEIQAGRLAMQRGTTREVRRYGRVLIEDHRSNDQNLFAFARRMGRQIPQFAPRFDAMENLRELQGPAFDRAFLQAMLTAHDTTIARLRDNLGRVDNVELEQMLRDEMPVLYRHRAMARQLLQQTRY